jgi:hypothetical protein
MGEYAGLEGDHDDLEKVGAADTYSSFSRYVFALSHGMIKTAFY